MELRFPSPNLFSTAKFVLKEVYIEGTKAANNYGKPALKAISELGRTVISFLADLLAKGFYFAKNDLPSALGNGLSIAKGYTSQGLQAAKKDIKLILRKTTESCLGRFLTTHQRALGITCLTLAVLGVLAYAKFTADLMKQTGEQEDSNL